MVKIRTLSLVRIKSHFAYLEKFSLNFSSSSFVIIGRTLNGLFYLSKLLFSFSLKVILNVAKYAY